MESKPTKRPEILAQWSRLPIPADLPAPPGAARDRVVDVITRTMLSPPSIRTPLQRALTIRAALGATATTALIVAAAVAFGHSRPSKEPLVARLYAKSSAGDGVIHGPEFVTPSEASSARALPLNSQVSTDATSSSRLQLVNGVEVVAGPQARLALPGEKDTPLPREELVLEFGVLQVRVPKLVTGTTFAVRTPNAVLSAHESAFSVEVSTSSPSGGPQTRVVVTDGVVAVQDLGRELLLNPGTEWTSGALEPEARKRVPRGRAGTISDSSELANQNRIFSGAINARDSGDEVRAITLLDDFIVRYPACPLTEDAYVARFRMLSHGDPTSAAKAARNYLTLYPNGLASQEARALAAGNRFE